MGGLRIMGYLPSQWTGKRVYLQFRREAVPGAAVLGILVSDNVGGVLMEVELPDPQPPLTAFIPWTSIQYVYLSEETESPRSLPIMEMPLGY
jgi:hypothetical protein